MADKPIFPQATIDRAFTQAASNIRTIDGLRHYVACRNRVNAYLANEPTTTPTSACEMLADYVNRWTMKQGHKAS